MYYEGKVKFTQLDERGKEHRVTASYVIDNCKACTEACEKLNDAVAVLGEDIVCVKTCAITEFINTRNDGDYIYAATIDILELDEKSGKEHHKRYKSACWANTLEEATERFKAYLSTFIMQTTLVSVKLTKYVDLIS